MLSLRSLGGLDTEESGGEHRRSSPCLRAVVASLSGRPLGCFRTEIRWEMLNDYQAVTRAVRSGKEIGAGKTPDDSTCDEATALAWDTVTWWKFRASAMDTETKLFAE